MQSYFLQVGNGLAHALRLRPFPLSKSEPPPPPPRGRLGGPTVSWKNAAHDLGDSQDAC